jgi:hypothetical protein
MAVGVFLGVMFIMVNQMLILFGIFVERSQVPGESLPMVQSQHAMAVFAFFLFFVYSIFGMQLFTFRNDIMEDGTLLIGRIVLHAAVDTILLLQ